MRVLAAMSKIARSFTDFIFLALADTFPKGMKAVEIVEAIRSTGKWSEPPTIENRATFFLREMVEEGHLSCEMSHPVPLPGQRAVGTYTLTDTGRKRAKTLWKEETILKLKPIWMTLDVRHLAQEACLPVLKDALEEAGANQEILGFCEDPAKGEWLLELISHQ